MFNTVYNMQISPNDKKPQNFNKKHFAWNNSNKQDFRMNHTAFYAY